ncbi:MAG TPA: hypothetical protein VIB62_09995, partial [Actinomycetota bacterium]
SLVVATADGSNAQEMSAPRVEHPGPVWSPTGDRIVFVSSVRGGSASTELRVFDVATGEVTSLTATGGSDLMWGTVLEFSPKGDQILFSRTEDRGRGLGSLWSVDADGSDLRRLVSGTTSGDWQSLSSAR